MPKAHTLAASCCLAIVGTALAQNESPQPRPPVGENPLLTDNSADQLLRERISRPVGLGEISPVRNPAADQVVPNQPADAARLDLADGSQAWTEPGTLRPEGTFLVGWVGEVVRLRTGGLAFLPVAKSGDRPEPAMALVPCAQYERIATVLGDQDRGLWLALTGEVLEYHERNYLLPTAFTATGAPEAQDQAPGGDASPDEATEQPEAQAGEQAEGQPDAQPEPETPPAAVDRIDELVRELEAERDRRRGIDTQFREEPREGAADPKLARLDGRMLLSRRARMVRSADGGWVIAVDNDHAGLEPELPNRIRLLPNRVVAQMEKQAENKGESWSFEVSGRLFRRGNTLYLLPSMFVTIAGDDVKPLQ